MSSGTHWDTNASAENASDIVGYGFFVELFYWQATETTIELDLIRSLCSKRPRLFDTNLHSLLETT